MDPWSASQDHSVWTCPSGGSNNFVSKRTGLIMHPAAGVMVFIILIVVSRGAGAKASAVPPINPERYPPTGGLALDSGPVSGRGRRGGRGRRRGGGLGVGLTVAAGGPAQLDDPPAAGDHHQQDAQGRGQEQGHA